jgi:uncharacterized protein
MLLPTLSLLFAGLLALMQLGLSIRVVLTRRALNAKFSDAGDETLRRQIQAHANFAEYVPIALILMLLLEMHGFSRSVLLVLGFALIAGRAMHAYCFLHTHSLWSRTVSTVLTLGVILTQALLGLWLASTSETLKF